MRWSVLVRAATWFLFAYPLVVHGATNTSSNQSEVKGQIWDYSVSGYYYFLKDERDYLLAIATADRGALHLEARYNYEALDSGSLFAGWKFSGGDKLTYELTPIVGAVMGATRGVAPGLEARLAWGSLDFYTEAEYLYDLDVREDSFTYAWSELGYSPVDWLRFGLVGQRTRITQSKRDVQRGLFAQLSFKKTSLGLFVFNPDDSNTMFATCMFGVQF